MKKFLCVFLSSILFCGILAACQKETDSNENDDILSENDIISDILSSANNVSDIPGGERGDEDLSPEDMAAVTMGFPAFAYAFAISEKDFENEELFGIDEIEYTGGEINLYCKLTAGGYSDMKIGIRAFINGIAQTLSDANETTTDMLCTEIEKSKSEIAKLTFTPNFGKEGDVLELSFDLISQPDIIKGEDDYYRSYEDSSTVVGNISLIMNADSSHEAENEICAEFSNSVTSTVNSLIYQSYSSNNGFEEKNEYYDHIGFGIYENIDDFIFIEQTDNVICHSTRINLAASENAELTLNLHGKPGNYRVCFLLNSELQNVFDGKRFTDVTVERNMQTELNIHIDTSKFSKNNKVCFYVYELDDEYTEDNTVLRTELYQLIITDAQ